MLQDIKFGERTWRIILSIAVLTLGSCGPVDEFQAKSKARSAVAATLADPGSAQFRNLRTSRVHSEQGSALHSVCGEVNSRNHFGGYVGYQPFLYVLQRARSPAEQASDSMGVWREGEVIIIAEPHHCGHLVDFARLCRDGSLLTDDEINRASPNVCGGF